MRRNLNKILTLTLLNCLFFAFSTNFCNINNKKFVIIIPSYNNFLYYKANLDSVFCQKYPEENFRIIYIDDNSSDHTANLVENYIKENKHEFRTTLIKNQTRQLALANIYKAILLCKDNEIAVLLDGDDELAHENVLNVLNEIYQDENIWITHGNFRYLSNGNACDYDPEPPEYIIKQNKFRDFPHGLIHLKTFYSWLAKQIKIEDLFFEDKFYKMTYDVALFTPQIEMAAERHKFIRDILYIYNDKNQINDHKVNVNLQHYLNREIRKKNKYQRINIKPSILNFNNIKIDVIIFVNDENNSKKLIKEFEKNSNNINQILLIDDNNCDNCSNYKSNLLNLVYINRNFDKTDLLNKIFNYMLDNGSKYIMFLNDKIKFETNLNIIEQLKNLELTKAFALYSIIDDNNEILASFKKNNIEIIKDFYAFSYMKLKITDTILSAIYRKIDLIKNNNLIEKLEIEWKYIGWKKVCVINILK